MAEQFERCFIAVPLPDKFQDSFQKISEVVEEVSPGVILVHPRVEAHITTNYLNPLTLDDLGEISKIVSSHTSCLKGGRVAVLDPSYISKEKPRHATLNVRIPWGWRDFQRNVDKSLGEYINPAFNNRGVPHMSLGRLEGPASILGYVYHLGRVARVKGLAEWNFPVDRLVVFGVKSGDETLTQNRLLEIPVER